MMFGKFYAPYAALLKRLVFTKGARGGGGAPLESRRPTAGYALPTKQPHMGQEPHISPYLVKAQTGRKTGHA